MLFNTCIPEKVQEYSNVSAFVKVLDSLQNYKREIIGQSLRVNNPAVLTDRKWLLKKLDEIGVKDFPENYPLEPMQLFLLNADTIFRTRGSKIGLELYCNVLTLGQVDYIDTDFYKDLSIIQLDSPIQGYITADNSKDIFYLASDSSEVNPEVSLVVSINTPFYNNDVVKKYLKDTLKRQIGFGNAEITLRFSDSDKRHYHKLLNPYFV